MLTLCSRTLPKCGNQFCSLRSLAKLFIVGANSSSATRNAVDMGKQNFDFLSCNRLYISVDMLVISYIQVRIKKGNELIQILPFRVLA